ncbi:hypothetical protein [Ktedonospora formicarum]|uniref:Uncharacterized protein n=1 Tax=Ktedonospora formicarum TaxID=2778364 RepID=A0A8J3I114_9CHLR|nr:hypothetical protein [Ktedonospora formicarum]GHO44708.1 hypothetical protein KSX_28710 [Ktedonospora formicarum]
MSAGFAEQYSGLLKDVFREQAQQQITQGADALTCADAYAEEGKPDFTLAFLLIMEADDEVKRELLARAYERRADLSEEKAEQFSQQYHRSFPLIGQEAQKDRATARKIREKQRVRKTTHLKALRMNPGI